MFIKTSNYLKTSPTRFPGAQSASLHPELPQGVLRSLEFSESRMVGGGGRSSGRL